MVDYLTGSLEALESDEESRSLGSDEIVVSFASDTPALRSYGYEILDVSNADLSFANSGNCPFLLDHDFDDHSKQIGVVKKAWVSGGKCKALIKFSSRPEAQGVIEDIKRGIRTNISVGYRVVSKKQLESQAGTPTFLCGFRVLEISSVSVPVDENVGVNRSETLTKELDGSEKPTTKEENSMEQVNEKEPKENQRSVEVTQPSPASVDFIKSYCASRSLESMAIDLVGKTELEVREAVLSAVEKRQAEIPKTFTPTPTSNGVAPAINVGEKNPTFDNNKAFRAALTKDWSKAGFEREMCQERSMKSGGLLRYDTNVVLLDPNQEVRANVTATTAGAGAELVGTTYRPDRLIDALWNKTFLDKIGTDTELGLIENMSFPVISSNATTSWVTETGALPTPQGLTTGLKSISPKEMVAKFEMTRQALIQDRPNVQDKILNQLYNAIAQSLDSAALLGASGVTLSTTGLLNEITGGQVVSMGTNGGAPTLKSFYDMRKLLVNNRINADVCKLLMSASLNETLHTTLKDAANTNSGYILGENQSTVGGLPFVWSQNVPNNLTKGTGTNLSAAIMGDFSEFLVAQWGSISVEFDYVTGSDNSKVYIRAFSFWDMIIKRLSAFVAVKDYIA